MNFLHSVIFFFIGGCGDTPSPLPQAEYIYTQPANLNDGWKTNSIKELAFDTTRVHRLFNQMQSGSHKLHSAILVYDNELIIEEYFNGESIALPHDLRSVTKSIRSLLLGIAIDKGYIQSIDDPFLQYISQKPKKNQDSRKEQITIKDLVTMSTGFDCNDWDQSSKGQEDKIYRRNDWIQYTLDLPMSHNPGEVSYCCTMGTVLLAEVISQASGMTIQDFADKHLFQPLDIKNTQWQHTSNKEVIPSAMRLSMTSRDLAKIGQLILNKGIWNEEQIISEDWINESTSSHTQITGMDYGFLWWNISFASNSRSIRSVTATGNGGQYIMIIPEMNVVGVFTGGAYNSEEDKLPFSIMQNVFLPMLQKS